jgi:hypothetical protein
MGKNLTLKRYFVIATAIAAAGSLFSGYLSFERMTSGVCAFSEPCPFFLGQPACYTGFALFLGAFAVSFLGWLFQVESVRPAIFNCVLGALGVSFAGRLTAVELRAHESYRLGLPTCAWGFIFFFALLVISVWAVIAREKTARIDTTGRSISGAHAT